MYMRSSFAIPIFCDKDCAKKRKQAPTNTLQSPSIPEADADYRLDIPEWKMKKIQAILDDASLSDDEKELKIAIEVG